MRAILIGLLFVNSYLLIPSIGVYEDIEIAPYGDGWHDTNAMGYGVARLIGSAWGADYAANHGHEGQIIIVGHSWGAFERLNELRPGDQVIVLADYEESPLVFEVYATETVWKTDTDLLFEAREHLELVLITCDAPGKRLIVRARYSNG